MKISLILLTVFGSFNLALADTGAFKVKEDTIDHELPSIRAILIYNADGTFELRTQAKTVRLVMSPEERTPNLSNQNDVPVNFSANQIETQVEFIDIDSLELQTLGGGQTATSF